MKKRRKEQISLLTLVRKWSRFPKFLEKKGQSFSAYTNERGEQVEKISDQARLGLLDLHRRYQAGWIRFASETWSEEDYQNWSYLMGLIREENQDSFEEFKAIATELQKRSDFQVVYFSSYVQRWYREACSLESRSYSNEAEKLALERQKADFSDRMLSILTDLKSGKLSFEIGKYSADLFQKHRQLVNVEWLPEKTRLELCYFFINYINVGV